MPTEYKFTDGTGVVRIDGNLDPDPSGGEVTYGGTSSFQSIAQDLTLEPAAGKSSGTAYLAAMMGNLLGDALTKTANYLGGLIGAYSVTGTKATTYPAGAVLAQITDGVTDVDGAVVAYIDGDSAQTNADAMFKVMCNNSTAASGALFGLDLQDAAHDGYIPVDAAFYKSAPIRIVSDVCILIGDAAPTNGTTGADVCGPGSLYLRTNDTNGQAYVNTNTKASPTWAALS